MATTQTPNYLLVKPTAGTNEPVSVQAHLDDNLDKIDQDMNRFDRQIFNIAGAGQTWNKPARAKRVIVRVVGAGGGSGGAGATVAGQSASSGGGGGGGYSEKLFLASALSGSETVDVGAGGIAGTNAPGNGGNGGTSNFATGKAYVVSSTGGNGGSAGVASGTIVNAIGGSGGLGSGGDINVSGGHGGSGLALGGGLAYLGNWGGSSRHSGQSPAVSVASVGNTGVDAGGGASGSLNTPSLGTKTGAAGAAGVVIVDTYY